MSNKEKEGYDFVLTPCCGIRHDLSFRDRRYMHSDGGKTITAFCPQCNESFGISSVTQFKAWNNKS